MAPVPIGVRCRNGCFGSRKLRVEPLCGNGLGGPLPEFSSIQVADLQRQSGRLLSRLPLIPQRGSRQLGRFEGERCAFDLY